jgi:predicted CXXCH cytochrome family protein
MTIGGQKLSLYIDEAVFAKSVHGKQQLACTNCHTNMRDYPHPPVTAQYPRELNRGIIQQACATCHKPIYDQYKESVHGKALLEESNLDVPSCTDCHGIHNIRDPRTALFRNESPDLCSKCHADRTLMAKYGISPDVTRTYLADFHGATVRLTEKKDPNIWSYKAVCYDCHGIHDIKKVDDPHSSVVKENLVKTCQKCHPGATANFPTAWASHYIPNREKWPVVYYVDLFYRIFIPTVIGAMVLYIILELARKALDHRKPGRKA